ncbi:hypothetical protein, partial [Salipiger bermudensis]
RGGSSRGGSSHGGSNGWSSTGGSSHGGSSGTPVPAPPIGLLFGAAALAIITRRKWTSKND